MRPKQKDKLAKFFYKLAEYTFAGLVIGAVINRPAQLEKILLVGAGGTFLFSLIGFRIDGLKERRK